MLASISVKKPSKKIFILLFLSAFILRSFTWHFYIQHEERYCQPDSNDYHGAAWCLAHNLGMTYPNGNTIFWRTPGYPLMLTPFYKALAPWQATTFGEHEKAQKAFIWLQIILCSLMPLLILWLCFILTRNYHLSLAAAWISVFHLGFILSSTYLLTDGIAALVFTLFLIALFKNTRLRWERPHAAPALYELAIAASLLAAYTWIRPMGQFVAVAAIIVVFFTLGSLWMRVGRCMVFLCTFFLLLSPWFLRNYQITGKVFFCPLSGIYLNVFNAPKIRARIENIPLLDAWKKQIADANNLVQQKLIENQKNPDMPLCKEQVPFETAWPWIRAYPLYFFIDWMTEVFKTSFDLYSSQLVAFANNCFKWDPLVEYLSEKLASCLYQGELPLAMRIICWLEFIFSLLIWIGIIAGIFFFLLIPWCTWQTTTSLLKNLNALWFKTGMIMGAVIMQSGGFGYARLRLPIESIMILLALTFWWWLFTHKKSKETHEPQKINHHR